MVCIVSSKSEGKVYRGRRTFGQEITSFMGDRSRWPNSLKVYFDSIKGSPRTPTISMLLDWMAQEAGIPELAEDSEDHKKFETLLGRYTRWADDPSRSAGQDIVLISAIAHCGIIRDESGNEVRDVVWIARLLRGWQSGPE